MVEGYVAGMHPSPYHGFSVEFAEHREYVPGDDMRHVDWKVWSKTDKFYLKQYEEETNLLIYLLLDTSESMAYASGQNVSKFSTPSSSSARWPTWSSSSKTPSAWACSTKRCAATCVRPAAIAPQGTLSRDGHTPAREKSNLGRSFTTWPNGSRNGAWWPFFSDLFDDQRGSWPG